MFKLQLFTFTLAVWLGFMPSALSQTSRIELETRLNDAKRLTKRAEQLSRQASHLARSVKGTLMAQASLRAESATKDGSRDKQFSLEVKSSVDNSRPPKRTVAPESQAVLQNYADLMRQYRTALSAYLQHRQEVQQHAAAFHAAAQNSNSPPPIQSIPEFRPLAVRVQDACGALQQAEGALHADELYLFEIVQMLMNQRKSMTPNQYASMWNTAEQRAFSFRQQTGSFDQGVVAKQQSIRDLMHGKMEEAMRNGDYVESQKVYGEQQRSSALLHEEVKRATTHSSLAMQFIQQLQGLSPNAPPSQSGSGGGQSPDQFVMDDRSLAQEFDQVQLLYKQVQAATPKFH